MILCIVGVIECQNADDRNSNERDGVLLTAEVTHAMVVGDLARLTHVLQNHTFSIYVV